MSRIRAVSLINNSCGVFHRKIRIIFTTKLNGYERTLQFYDVWKCVWLLCGQTTIVQRLNFILEWPFILYDCCLLRQPMVGVGAGWRGMGADLAHAELPINMLIDSNSRGSGDRFVWQNWTCGRKCFVYPCIKLSLDPRDKDIFLVCRNPELCSGIYAKY